MKAVERVIYNNYDLEKYFEDAKEYLIDEYDNEDPTENEIWDEIYRMDELDRDDVFDELKDIFSNGKFIAIGTCGLWTGNYAGGFVFNDFDEMCSYFSGCDYFKFWDENGHLFVKASHHDGTHYVEVKQLTEKGIKYLENWEYSDDKRTKQYVYEKLFNDSHYTRLLHVAHRLWESPKRAYEKEV